MNSLLHLFKKSFLYISAMFLALVLSYIAGVNPVLKAQNNNSTLNLKDKPKDPLDIQVPENITDLPVGQPQIGNQKEPAQPRNLGIKPQDSQLNSLNTQAQPLSGQKPTGNNGALDNGATNNFANPQVDQPYKKSESSQSSIAYLKHTHSYIGDPASPERDPFRKPVFLLEAEELASRPSGGALDSRLDDKIEAIRRWPITDYKLIGVIWDVQSPKAMILDPSQTMHLLRRNYRIGDRDGIISSISEGSITIMQDNVPVIINIGGK